MNKKIQKLYQKLRKIYGCPQGQWKLWCKRPKSIREREEVVIGAILTQNTNWQNVEKAIINLKKAGYLSLAKIYQLGNKDRGELEKLIRSAGFFRQKSTYLITLAGFFLKNKGIKHFISLPQRPLPYHTLRKKLLQLKGIGPETADSILNYSLDFPILVIDQYTQRLAKSLNLTEDLSYENLQKLLMANLTRDFGLFQDFHALIVIAGKNH